MNYLLNVYFKMRLFHKQAYFVLWLSGFRDEVENVKS